MTAPILVNFSSQQYERLLDQANLQGWQVKQIIATRWQKPADLHAAFAQSLNLPDYVRANLDALAEALIDLAEAYTVDSGLVIALQDYAISELAESDWHDDFMIVLSDVVAAWQEDNKHLMFVSFQQS